VFSIRQIGPRVWQLDCCDRCGRVKRDLFGRVFCPCDQLEEMVRKVTGEK